MPSDLSRHVLVRKTEGKSTTAPEKTSDRGSDESAKGTPVIAVETLLHKEKLTGLLSVAVVDASKDEDSQDTSETTDNDLKATPPVELVDETDHQDGNCSSGDEIGDEPDLKNGGGLESDDDDRDDDENDKGTDVPDVELVAEEIVGAGGDHSRLKTVKGSCAHGDDHDEHNANNPARKGLEEHEKGD